MHETNDAELMTRTRSGDHDAFAMLVDRHKHPLVNYLTHMTGSRDKAEEFAQEAFVRLYESANRYNEQGKLAPYLFRIATNVARGEAARNRLRNALLLRFLTRDEAIDDESPHRRVLAGEVRDQVTAALESLPVAYRAAVVLREIEGWSYDDIAQALGCSEGTVKSRISRGRDELRKRLSHYWNGVQASEPRRAF